MRGYERWRAQVGGLPGMLWGAGACPGARPSKARGNRARCKAGHSAMTLGGMLWRQRPFPGEQVRLRAVRCVLQEPLIGLIRRIYHMPTQRAMEVRQLEHTYASTKLYACSLNKNPSKARGNRARCKAGHSAMTLGDMLWRQRPFPGEQVRLRAVRCVLQEPLIGLIRRIYHMPTQRAMEVRQLEHTYASTKLHTPSLIKNDRMTYDGDIVGGAGVGIIRSVEAGSQTMASRTWRRGTHGMRPAPDNDERQDVTQSRYIRFTCRRFSHGYQSQRHAVSLNS